MLVVFKLHYDVSVFIRLLESLEGSRTFGSIVDAGVQTLIPTVNTITRGKVKFLRSLGRTF